LFYEVIYATFQIYIKENIYTYIFFEIIVTCKTGVIAHEYRSMPSDSTSSGIELRIVFGQPTVYCSAHGDVLSSTEIILQILGWLQAYDYLCQNSLGSIFNGSKLKQDEVKASYMNHFP
jgi:hypothetical protein